MIEIGVLFQDGQEKITKPMMMVRAIVVILMLIILVFWVINGLDFSLLKWIFILAGISAVFDGVAKFIQRNRSKAYLIEFGFALLWFALAYSVF